MEKTTSKTSCTLPIVTAVYNAVEYLGKTNGWISDNDQQKLFLADTYTDKIIKEATSLSEIQTRVSEVAAELNDWMKSRGFTIKLQDFNKDRGEFGCVSIMDVLVEWVEPGTKSHVYFNGDRSQEYPGVCVKGDNSSILSSKKHPHPIAQLETKTGDHVYMTIAETELEGLKLTAKVQDIAANLIPSREYEGVVFPMVDLNQEVDIGWLLGMKTQVIDGPKKDEWWKISQALQQTKFKMNEIGARAESAVAVGMMRGLAARSTPPMLRIEKPFLCWISRPGLSAPFFAGFLTQDSWKDPKSLA
jgi:hypothetical protein